MSTTGSSKWAVALVVGAVLFIGIPRAVALVQADSVQQVLGALLSIAFFAWLIWRLFIQVKDGWEQGPRFWYVSAAGFSTFLILAVALVAWDVAEGDFGLVVLIPLAVMALLVVSSLVVAKRAEALEPPEKS